MTLPTIEIEETEKDRIINSIIDLIGQNPEEIILVLSCYKKSLTEEEQTEEEDDAIDSFIEKLETVLDELIDWEDNDDEEEDANGS